MKELLPIGSVVLLKGASKRVIIVGRIQVTEDGEVHDYSSCLYPEGYLAPDELYMFNHEDIQVVYSMGYQDAAEFSLREHIAQALAEHGAE